MNLEKNDFVLLQAVIDKEIMPYTTNRVNKKYNIGHIKRELDQIINFNISVPLLAQLLRQRGVIEKRNKRGVSYFAISDEFFLGGEDIWLKIIS